MIILTRNSIRDVTSSLNRETYNIAIFICKSGNQSTLRIIQIAPLCRLLWLCYRINVGCWIIILWLSIRRIILRGCSILIIFRFILRLISRRNICLNVCIGII